MSISFITIFIFYMPTFQFLDGKIIIKCRKIYSFVNCGACFANVNKNKS